MLELRLLVNKEGKTTTCPLSYAKLTIIMAENVQVEEQDERQDSWELSESKAILRAGLLDGSITAEMKPSAVFNQNLAEHSKWPYKKWSRNFYNLRNAFKADQQRMQEECLSYGHDLAIVNAYQAAHPTGKPRWRGSEAARKLKEDVDQDFHVGIKPYELYQTRDEYQMFSLEIFRNHLYQEIDSRPKRESRFEKKKKGWKYPELHQGHPRFKKNLITGITIV